jgi:Mrp family chromosome partitioning ATPase
MSSIELTQPIEDRAWRRTQERSAKAAANGRRESRVSAAEAARTEEEALRLVQQIFLSQAEEPPRMVVFAGIEQSEGCSRICAAVAEALAKNSAGQVCLVEANFRSPILPDLFGTTNHYGLTNALLNKGPIRSFAKPLKDNEKLWLVSSGALTADSANLLSSEPLRARMAELRKEFEFVILDAPPLTRYSDAIATGQCADGLVLVLEAGSTRRGAAQMAAANLRTSRIPILGAVLNNRTFPIPETIYRRL